jgi:GTPase SAR1 family protein
MPEVFNILEVGGNSVGKTSLINQFIHKKYEE